MPVVRKNQNQYRKVYPGIRKAPAYDARVVLDENITMETGAATYTNNASVTYTFTKIYTAAPTVSATISSTTSEDNVNIYISAISTASVTIDASSINSGTVNLLIMGLTS